jgi:hypothetical protein
MQHPWLAGMQLIFGEQLWTARIISLFFTLLAVWGLWLFSRLARGETEALIITGAFVLNPLNTVFCNLPCIQIISIAATIWVLFFLLKIFKFGPRWSWIGFLWFFVWLASMHDWPWYPVAFFIILFCAIRLWPKSTLVEAWSKQQVFQTRTALLICCVIILGVFIQHFLRAELTGQLDNLMGAFKGRSAGDSFFTYLGVLYRDLSSRHTAILLFASMIWLVWMILKKRSDLASLLILAIFIGQTIWVLKFRAEFRFHEYRSYWYVPVFAFAAGDLTVCLGKYLRQLLEKTSIPINTRLRASSLWLFPIIMLGIISTRSLEFGVASRQVAGSIGFIGISYEPRYRQMMAARVMNALQTENSYLFVDSSLSPRIEIWWLLDGNSAKISNSRRAERLYKEGHHVIVMQSEHNLMHRTDWQKLAKNARILMIGTYAILDLKMGMPPSIEQTEIAYSPPWNWIDAWLHAPVPGRPVLIPGDRLLAQKIARTLNADQMPLYEQLPKKFIWPDYEKVYHQNLGKRASVAQGTIGRKAGYSFAWNCPPGLVLEGLDLWTSEDPGQNPMLARVRPLCKPFETKTAKVIGPTIGSPVLGNHHQLRCPDKQVVAGVAGQADEYLRSLYITCSDSSRSTTFQSQVIGESQEEKESFTCPAGSLAIGINGKISTWVRSIGLNCANTNE